MSTENIEGFEDLPSYGATGDESKYIQDTDTTDVLDRLVNRIKIKDGLDIDKLRVGGAATFEIDEDDVEATRKEYKEEFDYAHTTSYNQAMMGDKEFLQNLDYDGFGGYGLGMDQEDSENDGMEPFEVLAARMTNLTDDGGVKKRMKKPGGGETVMSGAQVHLHYNGYLEHHDEPFDSTRLRNKKAVVVLGTGQLIPGLEIGIGTMKTGEISTFLITSDYAFGDMGCPPRMPPKATVLFEVELLHFHNEAIIEEFDTLDNPEEMSKFERVYPAAVERRKEGRQQYACNRYKAAMNTFKIAASDLEKCNLQNEEEQKQQQDLLHTLFKNMAVVAMRMKNYHQTIKYGTKAMDCGDLVFKRDPKCNYLCGKANRLIGEHKMAKRYLEKALKAKPGDREIGNELQNLDNDIARHQREEKMMAQRMFAPPEEQVPPPDPRDCPWLADPDGLVRCIHQLEYFMAHTTNDSFLVPKDRTNSERDIKLWEEAARRLSMEVIERPSPSTGPGERKKMRIRRAQPRDT